MSGCLAGSDGPVPGTAEAFAHPVAISHGESRHAPVRLTAARSPMQLCSAAAGALLDLQIHQGVCLAETGLRRHVPVSLSVVQRSCTRVLLEGSGLSYQFAVSVQVTGFVVNPAKPGKKFVKGELVDI